MESVDIEKWYLQYSKIVYGYLLKCSYNEKIAEELTQETFYRAILSMERYQGACKESVWLCQIAKHVWYQYLKKEKKYVHINEDEWDVRFQSGEGFEQDILERIDKVTMYQCIRLLPKEMQEIVYLRLTGDLSFAEIGEIMNRSQQWARTNYYRAKEKLVKEVNISET